MSNSALKSVQHSIYSLIKQHKHSMSYERRYGLTSRLKTITQDLHQCGYIVRHLKGLKPKHIEALVDYWQYDKQLSAGTIKNRLADIRFVCRSMGKASIVQPNSAYQIDARRRIPGHNKAITNPDFSQIQDTHLKHSLALQSEFGLRREECLKIVPSQADQGNYLWLKGSWTKGKIERCIPITTQEQRQVLEEAKTFVGKNRSLIPNDENYIKQRYTYNRQTQQIGYNNLHGLRHAYAQQRYETLTGWQAPIKGGPAKNDLNGYQRQLDQQARWMIANELGHSRMAIAKIYLG